MARTKSDEQKQREMKKVLRSIRKGWEYMGRAWPKNLMQPSLDMLKAEVVRLAEMNEVEPKPRTGHWTKPKCIAWLESQDPEAGNDQEASSINESDNTRSTILGPQISPRRSGISTTFRQLSPGGRSNWSERKCAPRLINVIALVLKTDYLQRDTTLSRLELDARGQNWFWNKLAKVFNEDDNPELNKNMFSGDENMPEQVRNLIPERPEGRIASATMCQEKHRNLRKNIQKALNKFQVTGNGDDADTDLADGQVHSNDFSSYFGNNSAIYYVYLVLKRYSLLESFKVEMPDECKSTVASKSHCTARKRKSNGKDDDYPASFAVVNMMNNVLTSGVTIIQSIDHRELTRFTRQKSEIECRKSISDYRSALSLEYEDIDTKLKNDDLLPFIRKSIETRKVHLEREIVGLDEKLTQLAFAPVVESSITSALRTNSSLVSAAPIEDPAPASISLANDENDNDSLPDHPLASVSSPCAIPGCRVRKGQHVLPSTHVCGVCGEKLHAECCADYQSVDIGNHRWKCSSCLQLK